MNVNVQVHEQKKSILPVLQLQQAESTIKFCAPQLLVLSKVKLPKIHPHLGDGLALLPAVRHASRFSQLQESIFLRKKRTQAQHT